MDYYNIIISPGSIKNKFSSVTYTDDTYVITAETGNCCKIVYTAGTKTITGSTSYYVPMQTLLSSETLTGLTIPILIREDIHDVGYFTPFDGAILQQDVVTNFMFSSTTTNPYTYHVYNTSNEFQKFLELSSYTVDWGDGSEKQVIVTYAPQGISHNYPIQNKTYTITLEQINPWGKVKVSKKVTTPYSNVVITNPNGTAYFIPSGGNWKNTPLSYDYIFSGDAENIVSEQVSSNYTTVPFIISGITNSRVTELALYGTPKYQVGVPVIKNGEIFGAITDMSNMFTAYTIQSVSYYDYSNGETIFFEPSSGLTEDNITAEPIVKEEVLLGVIDQPQIQSNVFVERGKNSAYEKILRLGEVDNMGDLLNYGYGFFNVEKKS